MRGSPRFKRAGNRVMRILYLGAAAALSVATIGAAITAPTDARPPASDQVASESATLPSPAEASRFAKQATFGPTPELITSIQAKKSFSAWMEDQFSLSESTYSDIAAKAAPSNVCQGLTGSTYDNCYRDNFEPLQVQMRFYANAIGKSDQLRQRVAFAMSQIIVTSDVDVHNTAGLAAFNQILLSNAFGNYRDILKAVTLNAFMGRYLNLVDSEKGQPNENYARELMQLFSVGTVLLNPDGTPQTDNTGATIATYSNTDVKEVARALTGWTYARFSGFPLTDNVNRDWSQPMTPYPARFDVGSKTFLGKTVAAGATQQANIDTVLDTVFNHPNTAPYISKRLIQQLTLANPTPAYVARVAAVFANNGAGVRGDMKAVIRAIYLDAEARTVSQLPGKVKEPVLLLTSLTRAIGVASDGYAFTTKDAGMGQAPFRAPSVFNYYPYNFPLPQGDGLISPVSKLMTTATVAARHNATYEWTISGDPNRTDFAAQHGISGSTGTVPNWASWEAYGADDGKILDRINLVMLNGTMTSVQRQSILAAMAAVKNSNPALQTRKRAQVALYVVASSPLFQVDR